MHYVATENQPICPGYLEFYIDGENYRLTPLHASYGEIFKSDGAKSSGHSHQVYHIVLFARGGNQYRYMARSVSPAKNDLILVSPDEIHEFSPLLKGELRYNEFSFTLKDSAGNNSSISFGRLLSKLSLQSINILDNPISLDNQFADSLNIQLKDLLNNLRKNTAIGWSSAYKLIFDILMQLSELHTFSNCDSFYDRDRLDVVKSDIERFYAEEINIKGIAEMAALSPEHLIRSFKARFGITPKSYQINLKINAAKILLSNSGLRSKEIALKCGFSDVYNFSKIFKKRTGVSPGNYRATKNPKTR
ncbi:MAG: helix-turn-helix domain-containing protein [Planctomycetota bacterium]|jgi:AraC-like DNA-binding protein